MNSIDYNIEKIIRENMTEGMFQIDSHGKILFANEAASGNRYPGGGGKNKISEDDRTIGDRDK